MCPCCDRVRGFATLLFFTRDGWKATVKIEGYDSVAAVLASVVGEPGDGCDSSVFVEPG